MLSQCRFVVAVGFRIDRARRVDGEEREADGRCAIDVFRCLEMIGIRAALAGPLASLHAADRIVDDVLRCALRARHLANGLLWKDRFDAARHSSHRRDVTGGGETDPIAESEAGLQAESLEFHEDLLFVAEKQIPSLSFIFYPPFFACPFLQRRGRQKNGG